MAYQLKHHPELPILLAAALLRLLPLPPNFAPIGALALFGGATSRDVETAVLLPLAALLLSDLVIGFHQTMPFVYLGFALMSLLSWTLLRGKPNVPRWMGTSLLGSITFFVVSNFGVWLLSGYYSKTAAGLGLCLSAGLPFFRNTVLGDLCFSGLLLSAYAFSWRLPIFERFAIPARAD